jgi:hypothetical protein
MFPIDTEERRLEAAQAFDRQRNSHDGTRIVNSLTYGLTTLRSLLFTRVHDDVEQHVGRDSMIMPVSMMESEEKAKLEIEVFQVAVSTVEAEQRAYVGDSAWYAQWLAHLRLGALADAEHHRTRLERYLTLTAEERRMGFTRVLEKAFPEATRAPLILYRLFPLAVAIVTAVAFGDCEGGSGLRKRQTVWLPSITDCQECGGRLLDNGEQCASCSNPLWTYQWLTAAD